jgi:hypothetical protein
MRGDYMTKCPVCRREKGDEDCCAECQRCIDCVVNFGHATHGQTRLRGERGGEVTFPCGDQDV